MGTETPLALVFLGPPGAGKGTQAQRWASALGMTKISTGDILRQEIAAGTALGQQVQGVMRQGKLVSDQLLIELIEGRLSRLSPVRAIFDGFPRTEVQAEALHSLLRERGVPLRAVLLLEVPEAVLIERIASRGREGRDDDAIEVARKRQQVYRQETEPLVSYYAQRGLLRRTDGVGSPDQVYARIASELEQVPGIC